MYSLATLVKDIMAELVCLHSVDCYIYLQWRGGGYQLSVRSCVQITHYITQDCLLLNHHSMDVCL